MRSSSLDARLLAQLELALAPASAEKEALIRAARRSGLSLAEIDAAAAGGSFDGQTAAAIELGLAARARDERPLSDARQRGLRLGLAPEALDAIVALAEERSC